MSRNGNHGNVYCNQSEGVIAAILSEQKVLPYLIVFLVRCSMSMWTGTNKDTKLLHNSRVYYILLLEIRSGKRNGDVYVNTWPCFDAVSFVKTSSEFKEWGVARDIEGKRNWMERSRRCSSRPRRMESSLLTLYTYQ